MIQRFGVPETGLLAHRTVPSLLAPAKLISGRRRDVDALLAWGAVPVLGGWSALGCPGICRSGISRMVCCAR